MTNNLLYQLMPGPSTERRDKVDKWFHAGFFLGIVIKIQRSYYRIFTSLTVGYNRFLYIIFTSIKGHQASFHILLQAIVVVQRDLVAPGVWPADWNGCTVVGEAYLKIPDL